MSQNKINEEQKRTEILRAQLTNSLGRKKANEIIRSFQKRTRSHLGRSPSIQVVESEDVDEELTKLWDDGLVGISHPELIRIDDFYNRQRAKKKLMFRFFKYYLQKEEFNAFQTSIELVALIRDKHAKVNNRNKMIAGLYKRLDGLRYGRQIYNQVSIGRLERYTYPRMREIEKQLSPAGRVEGDKKEKVSQTFYKRLQPIPTEMWVSSSSNIPEIFGEMRDRLFPALPADVKIPHLDIYSAGRAREKAEVAVNQFLDIYKEYKCNEFPQPDDPQAGYLRIVKK